MMNDEDEAGREAAAEAALKETRETGGAVVIDDTATDDAAADNTAAGGTEEKIVDAGVEATPQMSETAIYKSYDDVQAGFLEVSPVGTALIEELKPKLRSHEQIQDADIDRVSEVLKTINNLLNTRFSDQGDANIYPELLQLKRDLLQVKIDNLLNGLPEGLLNGGVELADAGENTESQLQHAALQLAAMRSEDPVIQAKLAEMILAKLKNETAQFDPEIDTFEAAEKKRAKSGVVDDVGNQFDDAERSESDPARKKLILDAKVVWKTLGIGGMVAGVTFKTFVDLKKGDLGAFLSFLWNPTGRSSSGYEFGSATNENGEVPHYLFKNKFEDYRLVGKALHKCAPKLSPTTWASDADIQKQLRHVNETTDVAMTFDLLMGFNNKALKYDSVNVAENWKVFSKEFASALLGEDDVVMEDESIKFLKEKFMDDGAKLREFWRMSESGGVATPTKSESAPKPDSSG